jgi:hypothetical protein
MKDKYRFLYVWLSGASILEFLNLTVWSTLNIVTLLELDSVIGIILIVLTNYFYEMLFY